MTPVAVTDKVSGDSLNDANLTPDSKYLLIATNLGFYVYSGSVLTTLNEPREVSEVLYKVAYRI
jgi:hypothetical protein